MHCADEVELNVVRQEEWILFEAPLSSLLNMQHRFTERYTNHSLSLLRSKQVVTQS